MVHLREKGICNFKYPSGGRIVSIPSRPVSDEYKTFLEDVIENGKVNDRQYKRLNEDEQNHFLKVSEGAGLLSTFNLKKQGDDEEKKLVDRFTLLRGSLMTGNDADSVVEELKQVIVKLMKLNKIGKQQGAKMLMELDDE